MGEAPIPAKLDRGDLGSNLGPEFVVWHPFILRFVLRKVSAPFEELKGEATNFFRIGVSSQHVLNHECNNVFRSSLKRVRGQAGELGKSSNMCDSLLRIGFGKSVRNGLCIEGEKQPKKL
jgi:hypothetical protein